jgi:3D (Asp-Asp-Asp) domain-containing protein
MRTALTIIEVVIILCQVLFAFLFAFGVVTWNIWTVFTPLIILAVILVIAFLSALVASFLDRYKRARDQRGETIGGMLVLILAIAMSITAFIVGIGISPKDAKTNDVSKCKKKEVIQKCSSADYYPNATITAYTPSEDECDGDPENTALMEKPRPGGTCAVSHDLLRFLGDDVYIKGFGMWEVNDLMNKRYKQSIDLCVGSKKKAREIGRTQREVVFIED